MFQLLRDVNQTLLHYHRNGEARNYARINEGYRNMKFPSVPLYFHASNPVGILILVKSAAGNFANRKAYRSMWANTKYLSKFDIPIVYAFLIGSAQYLDTIPEKLGAEIVRHNDIILEDFVETYRNNTYKTIGGFKWALELGPNFEFLVMIDDDLYFSVEQTVSFLKHPHRFDVRNSDSAAVVAAAESKFGFQIRPDQSFYASGILGGHKSNMPLRT